VRGQDIEYGENAYQAWLTAIRDLALAVPSEALSDEDLAILNLLNLDLGSLLGRELPPTPELEAKALQSRLFETVLKLLRAYPKPLLMILEDLHWAMAESLQLTDYISQHLAASRVMLIASYRSDESPHLAEKLPAAQLLRLERLGEPAVQDLVGAVLGPKFIGGDWVQTLQQQTGGNAFFLTEILRALAEEAGELEAIQAGQDIIFTDQIGKIFDRRWGALSEACRALMQGAAVAGREIDLRLLTALWPGQELEALLGEAAEYHVAEWREGAWRFEHDKLRERILGRIPPDDLRGWHARIATGLESFYQQDSLGLLLLPMIAQHWEDAGRFLNAMPYLLQLTQEAFRLASYQEALGYIARLRRGIEAIDSPPSDIARQGMDTLYLEFYAYRQLEQRQHMPGVYAAALHLAERTGLDDLYLRAYQLGADTGALSYEPQLAQTCARQMLAYTSPDSGEAFLAYYRLSQGLRAERRFAEAVTVAEEALARLSGLDSGKPWKGWNFPSTLYILAALPSFFESRQAVGWSIATTLSYCHLLQGHYDRGLESLRRSLEEIHSLPNSGRYMMSLHNLALILQSHGDVGEALSLATTLAERAPKVFPALTHTADYLKRVIEARLAGEMAQAADLLHELALLNQSEQEIEDAIFCARSAQTLFESLGQGPKIAALLDLRRALNDPLG
jgi:tetratricopeptide (TPR) repeat protein